MSAVELSIWAALLGALLTFFGAALADALRNPTIASVRALFFIALTGCATMVMSGWVEHIFQIDSRDWLMPAKVTLGPLSGALALLYLGIWFGKLSEDPWLNRLIHWGSAAQCIAAAALLVAVLLWPALGQRWLQIAGAVNIASVIMALLVAARGVFLGDRLARAMVVACLCLGMMVLGLYAKGLQLVDSHLVWVITALGATAYFSITTIMTLQRNRQNRLLVKMAEGMAQADAITGLPVGGLLLSQIDDALWRSVRHDKECAVVAIWINNLYAYNDEIDQSIEHEIRHILTARIRRSIGFLNVLGLLQSRCFLFGVSSINKRQRVIDQATKLHLRMRRPMQVGVMLGKTQIYEPKIGIGIVFVGLGHMTDPLNAMDQAQALAKQAERAPSKMLVAEATMNTSQSSPQNV